MAKVASRIALRMGLWSCSAVLAGCLLKPEYERSVVITDNTYRDGSVSQDTIADLSWWEVFNDKQLADLITGALQENRDLQAAMARLEQARALVGVARPDQFPRVDAQGGISRTDASNASNFPLPAQDDFSLLAPLSFEVDLWGRYSSATEAQRAEMLASDEAYRAVTLSLVAQVAVTYLQLLDLDRQIIISERTLRNRHDNTKLIRERYQGGYTGKLDLNQAEIQEQDAAAALIALRRKLRLTENAMSVLLGHTPQPIPRAQPNTNPVAITKIPAGAPALLLERRPDVRAAEERARAAIMRVGVARSLQYPQISVAGLLGLNSGESTQLFSADGRVWSVGGTLLGPLIDFGKSWSRTSAAEAEAEQAVKQYEGVVLQAVREVEDAMVSIRTYDEEKKVRTSQVASATSGDKLSRSRYDNGVASFLEVLNTQTSLFQSELAQSNTQQLYLSSIVQLYKALGGGWQRKEGPVKLPEHGWEFYQ